MAEELSDDSQKRLHGIEQSCDKRELSSLCLLPEPPERQLASHMWQNDHADHEAYMAGQPLQPPKKPFIVRPDREDPTMFQEGFQFSKAPIPKILSSHRSALSQAAKPKGGPTVDDSVQIEHQNTGYSQQRVDESLQSHSSTGGDQRARNSSASDMEVGGHDAVALPTVAPLDSALHEKSQHVEPGLKPTEDSLNIEHSPSITQSGNKLRVSPRVSPAYVGSSGVHSGRARLPKAFSDIQRKALIQSNHMNRFNISLRHSMPPVTTSSPSISHQPLSKKYATNTKDVFAARAQRNHKHELGEDSAGPSSHISEERQVDAHRKRRKSKGHGVPAPRDAQSSNSAVTRPISQASNIAKPRAPPVHEPARARKHQISPTLIESNDLRQKLSNSWNQFFMYEHQRNKNWETKIARLVEQLSEQDEVIADYLTQIQTQDQIIAELKTENENQRTANVKNMESAAASEERQKRLKERMKEYRERLNDIVKEQQTCFKHFQSRYQQAREQLKQTEENNRNSVEEALSVTQEIRGKIQKSIREVESLSHEEIQKLHAEVAKLQTQLVERDKAIDREREHVKDLRRELDESHGTNKGILMDLKTQSEELVESDIRASNQLQIMKESINEQCQGIQSLIGSFEKSETSCASNASKMEESLCRLQAQIIDSVTSNLHEHAVSQCELTSKATDELNLHTSAVRELCANVSKQVQSSKTDVEWQEKLLQVQIARGTVLQEISQLRKEIAEGQKNANAAAELRDRVASLEEGRRKTQESLIEKDTSIQCLEAQLAKTKETLAVQNRSLEDQERRLCSEREEYSRAIASYREQQERLVKEARKEESAKNSAELEDLTKRLQAAEHEQSQLISTAKRKEDEYQARTKTTVDTVFDRMDKILDGVEVSERNRNDLKAKLEAWSTDHIGLPSLQQAIQKLATDQQDVIADSKTLGELLVVHKKLGSTLQFHKSEVDALDRAMELEKSVKAYREKGDRRVTIRSPGSQDVNPDNTAYVSIEEERDSRRRVVSLTGIMKSTAIQVEGRQEKLSHTVPLAATKRARGSSKSRTAARDIEITPASHSTYNRPVLGTPPGDKSHEASRNIFTEALTTSKRKRAGSETTRDGSTEGKGSESAKRHQANTFHSTSSYFPGPITESL